MTEKEKLDLSMFLNDYLNDAREGFQSLNDSLLAIEKDYSRTDLLDEIFRVVHTLKSSSTMIEFFDIAVVAHTSEDFLDRMRKGEVPVTGETINLLFALADVLDKMVAASADRTGKREYVMVSEAKGKKAYTIEKTKTVRVDINILDSMFNMVGELIITRNRIDNIVSDAERKDLRAALTDMNRIINVLQENVSTARLVPADEIFQKFPRMVRDMAKEQGKEIELVVEGREIELDKSLIDALTEPLVHMLRNAVDHGIETPEARKGLNKKPAGKVRLSAQRTENHILIDVEDDGAGIDIEKMRGIAAKKGFVKPEDAPQMKERDVLNLLFRPGFSSIENATGVSGRGVGLDVVLTSAKKMGGMVEIASEKDKGTKFSLKLPLTTSLIQTLIIGVGDDIFAVPSDIVLETIEVDPLNVKEIGSNKALILRGEAIPFLSLQEILHLNGRAERQAQQNHPAIIIHNGDKFIAVGVDAVLDQMENIIKPFDPIAQQFRGFSGGIIMGDGRVALLLDIPSLLELEALKEEEYKG